MMRNVAGVVTLVRYKGWNMQLTTSISRRSRMSRCHGSQAGVGLIEVLIAVLVLSIGFLGMAALQSKALSNNNSAMVRSIGTIATYSILDAMRVDKEGTAAGDYAGSSVTVPSSWSAPGDCSGLGTGSDLSKANLNQWCDDLGSLMGPGTKGEITDVGSNTYDITITFNDERATGGSASETMITRARL